MHVVATAGHVDHGKSTLVRALTGQEPDRLPEEQRRGLTIELGYCWTRLPAAGRVAFVDVPGHERFVPTMLAGVGPVPVACLVVAADDPWMPQADEHLAVLDALGVRHGVLVVTRADLADPGPALAEARRRLAGTSLAGVPDVVVSGRTGEGLPRLRETLDRLLAALPAPRTDGDVRLWVDRSFRVAGAGTVVTGTLVSGTVRPGDTLSTGTDQVRVRGLQTLGEDAVSASAVARVALQLGGRVPASVARGRALVTPDAFLSCELADVRLRGPGPAPEGALLHVGSARVQAHVRPLGADWFRLRLDSPLPLRVGDRAVLRDPGSRAVWGVVVADPDPPGLARRGAARRRAAELDRHDGTAVAEVDRRGTARRSALLRAGFTGDGGGLLSAGDWWLSPARATALSGRLAALVEESVDGIPSAEAVRVLGLPEPRLLDLVVPDSLRVRAGRVVPTVGGLTEADRALLDALGRAVADAPFVAPTAAELAGLGIDAGTAARLHRDGHLLRLADGVVLPAGSDDRAVQVLAGLPEPFTASEARQALGTSRRVVLPLLRHLDAAGRTLRLPDDRRRLRR